MSSFSTTVGRHDIVIIMIIVVSSKASLVNPLVACSAGELPDRIVDRPARCTERHARLIQPAGFFSVTRCTLVGGLAERTDGQTLGLVVSWL